MIDVRRVVAKIATELEGRRREALEKITPEDKLLAHLQTQEARAWLSQDDPLANLIAATQAAQDGDQVTLDAILEAPASWPGKPTDLDLTELREQRVALAVGPEATEEAQQLAEVHDDLASALGATENGIREAAGTAAPDPVAEQAAGDSAEAA